MSKALAKAIDRKRKAEDELARILKRDYPEGGPVAFDRNGIHSGTVVMHSCHDRIKVRNDRTGKELWIYAYAIDG